MKKYNKAFKFRILPTKRQEILIHKTFGSTRLIYNMFLDKRIKLYENEKKSTAYNTQANELTSLKKDLDLKSMKIKNLAKHTFDNAWGMFVNMLEYKAKFKGK
ncbi:helix-turn-helix domain-containing protein [Psychrilyobacter sp.]|uniref:helix-turn-helix domain-containing protein n=1 Tax=Psychrilyobacter sp. TaxID=2586924 RepID=UPI00301616CD